jgi:putative PIN family toxin of toxin-antitoxin system
MIKAVLDTNTLISALGWEGKQQVILNYCLEGKFKLVLSYDILKEVKEVLYRKKFDFIEKEKKDEFILLLSELADIIEPNVNIDICRDKADNKLVELAVFADVNVIVSGDEDLLELKEYKGIKILHANQFLDLLQKSFFGKGKISRYKRSDRMKDREF